MIRPRQRSSPPAPSALAVALSLPAGTPNNVVRMIAGEFLANNEAHEIKTDYDTNNPPPAARQEKTIEGD